MMFKSIRWKFILVYFLLVFIAMVIVGVFILEKFETQQLEYRKDQMFKQIESIIHTSTYLNEPDLIKYQKEIQETINKWNIDISNTLYIIAGDQPKRIIASSHKDYKSIVGKNAYSYDKINPALILESYNTNLDSELINKAYDEKIDNLDIEDPISNIIFKHVAYPIIDDVGRIKGVAYMTSNLDDIYTILDGSKKILVNATALALLITVILGFLIANSITDPIRDVTDKAEKMAKGDFDQYVEAKSDDEIGQLANMFNYLTLKLKGSIQEIELERSKLDTIFKYMADGVIAIDTNNILIHANPVALDILKIENDNINLVNKGDLKKDILDLEVLDYKDRKTLEREETIFINSKIYKIKFAPFINDKKNIGGVIIVFQDITEQHRLDNMRREFVANVSHELKTPITTIKSYTETLLEYEDIDIDTSRKFLGIIDNECDRMNKIVRDLLQLSNMDYKKTKWEKTNFSLKTLVDDTVLKLKISVEEKKQRIDINMPDILPDIYADRDSIQQVLINIISNSMKYTEKGGEILVSAFQKDNSIILRVKDNGIGIPELDQDRIFERFYRVDKGRARLSGGSGLGLSIAKQIIEEQNGKIELKSELDKGTEVDIIFDLS